MANLTVRGSTRLALTTNGCNAQITHSYFVDNVNTSLEFSPPQLFLHFIPSSRLIISNCVFSNNSGLIFNANRMTVTIEIHSS